MHKNKVNFAPNWLVVSGLVVMFAALLNYVARDVIALIGTLDPNEAGDAKVQQCANPYIVPCSKEDPARSVYKVKDVGLFCIETTGQDITKQILRDGKAWEPHLRKVYRKYIRPSSVAVDIGAHIGTQTIVMSDLVGPNGQVIAFEPVFKTYHELVTNLELNRLVNVHSHFAALGDKFGRISMNLPSTKDEGAVGIGSGANRVEMHRLDSYNLNNVSLIKIDVEGAEEMVLEGAKETIARNRPAIVIEVLDEYKQKHAAEKEKQQLKQRFGRKMKQFEKMQYRVKKIDSMNFLALPLEMEESSPTQKPVQNAEKLKDNDTQLKDQV